MAFQVQEWRDGLKQERDLLASLLRLKHGDLYSVQQRGFCTANERVHGMLTESITR